jgi:hypothetical protein
LIEPVLVPAMALAPSAVNAVSAIRGCLRIVLLLGSSETRWAPSWGL